MLIRSFNDNFKVTDWTEELVTIPNTWGTIGRLGIFQEIPVAASSVTFEETSGVIGLIGDRVRGERNSVSVDQGRKVRSFAVPHFPLDDAILPKDLAGVRAYGAANGEVDPLVAARVRKMQTIRQSHAITLEKARAQLVTAGTVYSPNGTVSQNWFTEFGISQTTVDFLFGTGTTEILDKIDQVVYTMQTQVGNGGTIAGIAGLCSRTFFSALIKHPKVAAAYNYYSDKVSSNQDPLRTRMGGTSIFEPRKFDFGGVLFIEMNDTFPVAGVQTPLIPAGDCAFVPMGTDAFRTYFAPAERFGIVNTLGEQVYMFENASTNGTKIEIETESNFVNACFRPQLLIRGFSSN